MKKILGLLAISAAATLSADYYNPSCPNGNCPYQGGGAGGYSQAPNQGYNQRSNGAYVNQGYNQGNQGYANQGYNQGNQGYANQEYNQGYNQGNQDQGYVDDRVRGNGNFQDNRRAPAMNDNNNNNYSNYNDRNNNANKNLSDADIQKNVSDALTSWFSSAYKDITFDVSSGVVTLHGDVKTANDKRDAEKAVSKIDGVKQVDNRINVLDKDSDRAVNEGQKYPNDFSATDADRKLNDDIRNNLNGEVIARAIVIKTNNGVVTVTGYVDSFEEVKKLNDKIRGVSGVKAVNNQVVPKNK